MVINKQLINNYDAFLFFNFKDALHSRESATCLVKFGSGHNLLAIWIENCLKSLSETQNVACICMFHLLFLLPIKDKCHHSCASWNRVLLIFK